MKLARKLIEEEDDEDDDGDDRTSSADKSLKEEAASTLSKGTSANSASATATDERKSTDSRQMEVDQPLSMGGQ